MKCIVVSRAIVVTVFSDDFTVRRDGRRVDNEVGVMKTNDTNVQGNIRTPTTTFPTITHSTYILCSASCEICRVFLIYKF